MHVCVISGCGLTLLLAPSDLRTCSSFHLITYSIRTLVSLSHVVFLHLWVIISRVDFDFQWRFMLLLVLLFRSPAPSPQKSFQLRSSASTSNLTPWSPPTNTCLPLAQLNSQPNYSPKNSHSHHLLCICVCIWVKYTTNVTFDRWKSTIGRSLLWITWTDYDRGLGISTQYRWYRPK